MSEMRNETLKEKTRLNKERMTMPAAEKEQRGSDDEKYLISMLKNQDSLGLRILINKYNEKLFAVANRICNNPADAEEVLQDVYLIAMNKIEKFEERSTLSTWLYRITVNAALMKLRSQRNNKLTVTMEKLTAMQHDDDNMMRFDEESRSPDDSLLTRELYERIQDSVETLPEIYQNVFFLRDIQGFSIKETSEMLKTTPAAIKSRLHRSRFFLQEKLKTYLCEN
jgi:RNA polymerase sigma-70 factor (ECF subfamily)